MVGLVFALRLLDSQDSLLFSTFEFRGGDPLPAGSDRYPCSRQRLGSYSTLTDTKDTKKLTVVSVVSWLRGEFWHQVPDQRGAT